MTNCYWWNNINYRRLFFFFYFDQVPSNGDRDRNSASLMCILWLCFQHWPLLSLHLSSSNLILHYGFWLCRHFSIFEQVDNYILFSTFIHHQFPSPQVEEEWIIRMLNLRMNHSVEFLVKVSSCKSVDILEEAFRKCELLST